MTPMLSTVAPAATTSHKGSSAWNAARTSRGWMARSAFHDRSPTMPMTRTGRIFEAWPTSHSRPFPTRANRPSGTASRSASCSSSAVLWASTGRIGCWPSLAFISRPTLLYDENDEESPRRPGGGNRVRLRLFRRGPGSSAGSRGRAPARRDGRRHGAAAQRVADRAGGPASPGGGPAAGLRLDAGRVQPDRHQQRLRHAHADPRRRHPFHREIHGAAGPGVAGPGVAPGRPAAVLDGRQPGAGVRVPS